jgi:hypothetical protein
MQFAFYDEVPLHKQEEMLAPYEALQGRKKAVV